jgi:hypothetical protein
MADWDDEQTPVNQPLNAAGLATVLRRRLPFWAQTELVARLTLARSYPEYAPLHDEAIALFLTGLCNEADRE